MILTAAIATAGLVRAIIPIDGTNAVGYITVAVPANTTNTIISVPFEKCLTTSAEPGVLKDLVATNGLTAAGDAASADQLIVLTTNGAITNGTDKVYYYYWLKSGYGWTNTTTAKLVPAGTEISINTPAADAFAISRGLGFWIKRAAPDAAGDLYLKGQLPAAKQATVITNGLNLVGFGYTEALTLNTNTVSWTGASGGTNGNTTTSDKIMVVSADGSFKEYFFFTNPKGWTDAKYIAASNKWINNNYTVATNVTIPAGQGFWYLRRNAAGFTFRPDGE